jgi:hypothetical protein
MLTTTLGSVCPSACFPSAQVLNFALAPAAAFPISPFLNPILIFQAWSEAARKEANLHKGRGSNSWATKMWPVSNDMRLEYVAYTRKQTMHQISRDMTN